MTYSHVCPFCEEGTAHETVYSNHIKLGRRSVLIEGLKKTVCELCGSESVPEDFHNANLALILQAGETCRGAVTPGMLRTLRESWTLTQKDASLLFGAGKSSFAKWEAGQSKLSTPSALLIQCAMNVNGVIPYLAKLVKFELGGGVKHVECKAKERFAHGAYETVQLSVEKASNAIFMLQTTQRTNARNLKSTLPNSNDWSSTVVSSDGEVKDVRTYLEAA